MLKSLEELKYGLGNFFDDGIAEKIQAEIDKYYLPLPLFEDGEPVQIGDKVADGIEVFTVERVSYGQVTYYLEGDNCLVCLTMEDRVSRPPEPDTQEKIDEDSTLTAREYCDKRGLNASYDSEMAVDHYPEIVMRLDLLARQRKLDGVES